MEQPVNDRKKVQQPSFGQGTGHRFAPISFAEHLIVDVRMGDTVVRSCRIGLQRHHAVGMNGRQTLPIQLDLKRAQCQLFEHHILGRQRDQMVCQVHLERWKFLLERR